MLITSISVPDDKNTLYGLRCSITAQKVLVSSTKLVKVSAIPQVTGKSSSGQVLPQTPNESILFQLGLFGSGKNQSSSKYLWPVPGNIE